MIKKFINLHINSKFLYFAALGFVLWVVIAYWLICVVFTNEAIKLSVDKLASNTSYAATNIASDIDIQVKYIKEQPSLLSVSPDVLNALNKNISTDLTAIAYEKRKLLLNDEPSYHKLSVYFDELEHRLGVNQIFLIDGHGFSVASSNWNKDGSSIGTNYADRLNFQRGKSGLSTTQYAMGRTTHIPGLFFSSPIFQKGKFLGLMVVKLDLQNLAQFKSSQNIFLVDSNQVIVEAHDKRISLLALSETAIGRLNKEQLFGLYQTENIPILKLKKWNDIDGLVRIYDDHLPFVVSSKSLNEYSMDVYVLEPFNGYFEIIEKYRFIYLGVTLISLLLFLILGLLTSFVSNTRKNNHQLWHQVNHNPLTDLPNQLFLQNYVDQLKNTKTFENHCLIYIDIDRFKEVNDRYGHELGNLLIKEVAVRIKVLLPPNSLLSHIGSDRFGVLLYFETDQDSAKKLCLKIHDSLETPFRFNGLTLHIKSTIAYMLFTSKVDFLNKVFLQVESLIKELRRSKGGKIGKCTQEFSERQARNLVLKNDLINAVKFDQIIPFFQPIVNLRTGKVEKAELLARWSHPKYGWISPQEFIQIAEQSGFILQMGIWLRRQAILYCKKWIEIFQTQFQISINKSPLELLDSDVETSISYFNQQILEAGLKGSNFAFEITESVLVSENFTVYQKIDEVNSAGIRLSIDDFGTGFSSLSYLNRFPISFIKLDISFIANLKKDSSEEIVCKHVISMAHSLGISVIAEGVETLEQRNILLDIGCDYAQGYFYSPALNPSDFEEFLRKENVRLDKSSDF